MLKLDHKAMRGTDVSYVLFPGLPIVLDKLLEFDREATFPPAVPIGFSLGPGITIPNSQVRPVGNSVRAAFSNNFRMTKGTRPLFPGAGLRRVDRLQVQISYCIAPVSEAKSSV